MIEAEPIASFVFECRTWLGIPERGMSEGGKREAVKAILVNALFCAVVVCGGLVIAKQWQESRWGVSPSGKTMNTRTETQDLDSESKNLKNPAWVIDNVAVPDVVPQVTFDDGYDPMVPIE